MVEYNKALYLDPHNGHAYWKRGEIYSQDGQPQKAITDLNKAIELDPRMQTPYINGVVFTKLAGTSSSEKTASQAKQDFGEAVKVYRNNTEPRDANIQFFLGTCYQNATGVTQTMRRP